MHSGVIKLTGCILAALMLAVVSGCNSRQAEKPYPSGRALPDAKYGQIYTVKRGDTLYSIAWAIKKDFRTVAQWNVIRSPYRIYPGQKLRMYPPARKTTYSSRPQSSQKSTSRSAGSSHSKKPVYSKPPPTGKVNRWLWPTSSRKVTARFSPSVGRDGIDISGRFGDSVYATADGQVVYAGSGLRGYGKLIILKHNKTYLSAYAHNDNILVAEGQSIKAGHKIGKMGSSGGRAKLHFEIRKNGKPVDPTRYLSSR
jgi:lipoprotein NlpD